MISDDIKVEFHLDKCAKATFKRGMNVPSEGIQLDSYKVIKDLETDATY